MAKLCKDCTHHRKSYVSDSRMNFDKCSRPIKISLVTGKSATEMNYCDGSRDSTCGPEARYFEQKKTLWMKVKNILDNIKNIFK